jgi:hypothetical protein
VKLPNSVVLVFGISYYRTGTCKHEERSW